MATLTARYTCILPLEIKIYHIQLDLDKHNIYNGPLVPIKAYKMNLIMKIAKDLPEPLKPFARKIFFSFVVPVGLLKGSLVLGGILRKSEK